MNKEEDYNFYLVVGVYETFCIRNNFYIQMKFYQSKEETNDEDSEKDYHNRVWSCPICSFAFLEEELFRFTDQKQLCPRCKITDLLDYRVDHCATEFIFEENENG